ncbi:hypothetical protein L0F63_005830, partial [Massospora cicadina]
NLFPPKLDGRIRQLFSGCKYAPTENDITPRCSLWRARRQQRELAARVAVLLLATTQAV